MYGAGIQTYHYQKKQKKKEESFTSICSGTVQVDFNLMLLVSNKLPPPLSLNTEHVSLVVSPDPSFHCFLSGSLGQFPLFFNYQRRSVGETRHRRGLPQQQAAPGSASSCAFSGTPPPHLASPHCELRVMKQSERASGGFFFF